MGRTNLLALIQTALRGDTSITIDDRVLSGWDRGDSGERFPVGAMFATRGRQDPKIVLGYGKWENIGGATLASTLPSHLIWVRIE